MRKYSAIIGYGDDARLLHTPEFLSQEQQITDSYGGIIVQTVVGKQRGSAPEMNGLLFVYDPDDIGPKVFEEAITTMGRLLNQKTIILERTEVDAEFRSTSTINLQQLEW